METLYNLKQKLNINDDDFDEIKDIIDEMNKRLKEEKIILNKQFKIGFYSHIIAFIKRLKEHEKVMEISDEVVTQLEEWAITLSEELLKPLFEKYNTPIDISEVYLVAIHLQTAKNSREGGDKID